MNEKNFLQQKGIKQHKKPNHNSKKFLRMEEILY